MKHSKIALGGIHYVQNTFISAGLCLHSYNNESPQEFKRIVTYPLSCELGAGTSFKWFAIAFSFDFIKNESSLYFGIRF
jgi:hypothetical protein